jgi:hypothetical protein
MSYQSEKTQLAEELGRALSAMNAWTPSRCVEYEITLGIVDRKTDFTTDFGGEATPEPDSVAWLRAPSSVSLPLIRLLYLLQKNGDDICLDAPTAQAITGEPFVHGQPVIAGLLRVLHDAATAGFVRRTDPDPHRLTEADRHTIVGLTLTDPGRRYLDDMLASQPRAAPPTRAAAHGA